MNKIYAVVFFVVLSAINPCCAMKSCCGVPSTPKTSSSDPRCSLLSVYDQINSGNSEVALMVDDRPTLPLVQRKAYDIEESHGIQPMPILREKIEQLGRVRIAQQEALKRKCKKVTCCMLVTCCLGGCIYCGYNICLQVAELLGREALRA
jgi:hypothetical protein